MADCARHSRNCSGGRSAVGWVKLLRNNGKCRETIRCRPAWTRVSSGLLLVLLVLTYAAWAGVTAFAPTLTLWVAVPALALILAQHSSLQHEIIHGHPTRNQRLNDALVFPALGLLLPFERFRDQHLAHHYDPLLTDPHDDPETNYLDPEVWARLRRPVRAVLAVNNTLFGRMLIGPFLGMFCLWRDDLRALRRRRPAGGAGLPSACRRDRAGGPLAGGGRADAGLGLSARLLARIVDPAHPDLPRAPGARAGRRAQRHHRGSRAAGAALPQQQLPRGPPRQSEAALVPAARRVRAAAGVVAAAQRRLRLPLLRRRLHAPLPAAQGSGGAPDLDPARAGRRGLHPVSGRPLRQ